MTTTTVFLSYSARDRHIARRLAFDLRRFGVRVWFDQDEILAGDVIVERIRDGMRDANYLLVLVSAHSRDSSWVTREVGEAFLLHGRDAQRRIIPIRLDDAPIPEALASIRYVDLRDGYDRAVDELVSRLARDEGATPELDEIVNADQLARALSDEVGPRRGPESYVTAILSVLTLIITLVTAWPSFETAFGRVSRVYYDVESQAIRVPAGADTAQVLRILDENGIAPAGLRIRVINKGQARADEVRVGADVEGEVTRVETSPRADSNPVWVDPVVEPLASGSKRGRVTLSSLVPERIATIDVGYKPPAARYECDVVADGVPASRVDNIGAVPSWSLYTAFKAPLQIVATGLLVSFLVGVLIAASRNPRLREKMLTVLEAVSPALGRVLRSMIS